MIEKVKKILEEAKNHYYDYYVIFDDEFPIIAETICQLFKPDRPELREKIEVVLWGYPKLRKEILALIPDIEEAKREEKERSDNLQGMY